MIQHLCTCPSTTAIHGEANSGDRYRDLFRGLITERRQLLVPIILYLDCTAIDSEGHIEVCPISFTTGQQGVAWRLLGYVPDLNRGRSSAVKNHAISRLKTERGCTTRSFHKVMDVIFTGLAECQAGKDSRLRNVPLQIGGKWIVVDIVCPLLFVLYDGKQGGQLCCRVNGHHPNQRHHHLYVIACLKILTTLSPM